MSGATVSGPLLTGHHKWGHYERDLFALDHRPIDDPKKSKDTLNTVLLPIAPVIVV